MAIHEVVIQILLPISLGFVLRQTGMFGDEQSAVLRKLVVYVSIPLLVFHSMYTSALPSLSQAISIVAALPILTLLFHLAGSIISRLLPLKHAKRMALLAAITFGNYGWLGWSAAFTVFGEKGLNQAFFFTLLWWPVFYGFGALTGIRSRTKKSISPRSVAIVTALPVSCISAGIVLNLASIAIPEFLLTSVSSIGDTTIPLILISVGMGLNMDNIRRLLPAALLVSAIRLGLGPLMGILTSEVLPVGDLGTDVVILLSAMPVATVTPILCDYFEMDRDLISVSIVVSTVLSLGTLPLVLMIIG